MVKIYGALDSHLCIHGLTILPYTLVIPDLHNGDKLCFILVWTAVYGSIYTCKTPIEFWHMWLPCVYCWFLKWRETPATEIGKSIISSTSPSTKQHPGTYTDRLTILKTFSPRPWPYWTVLTHSLTSEDGEVPGSTLWLTIPFSKSKAETSFFLLMQVSMSHTHPGIMSSSSTTELTLK
jgi:hypothetical protein